MPVPTTLFQIKIQAKDIRPSIYRTIILPNTATFYDLHVYIQDMFELSDYHLFSFNIPIPGSLWQSNILTPYIEGEMEENDKIATDVVLKDVFNGLRKRCTYWYDFGDDWMFTAELQKELPLDTLPPAKLPFLLKAKGPNLLEDCRGNWGFEELISMKQYLEKGGKVTKEFREDLEMKGYENVNDFIIMMEGIYDIDWDDFLFSNPKQRLKEGSSLRQ